VSCRGNDFTEAKAGFTLNKASAQGTQFSAKTAVSLRDEAALPGSPRCARRHRPFRYASALHYRNGAPTCEKLFPGQDTSRHQKEKMCRRE